MSVIRKSRMVTSSRHLRVLLTEYADIRRKMERSGGEVPATDILPVIANGEIADGPVGCRPNLELLYQKWAEMSEHLKVKAHHHAFSIPANKETKLSHGALSRYVVAHVLGTFHRYQSWARPNARLSMAVGYHSDKAHPHAHALVMPVDSRGRAVNFSRLAPVKTAEGVVRVDFQGFLFRAYAKLVSRYHERETLFSNDNELRAIVAKLSYSQWFLGLHSAFMTFAENGQTVDGQKLINAFAEALRSSRSLETASSSLKADISAFSKNPTSKQATPQIIDSLQSRIDVSRLQRDVSIKNAGTWVKSDDEPDISSIADRLGKVRAARDAADLHRLRTIYAITRAVSISRVSADLIPEYSHEIDGGNKLRKPPVEVLLNRALIRMHEIQEEHRAFSATRDSNQLLSPFEQKKRSDRLANIVQEVDETIEIMPEIHNPPRRIRLPNLSVFTRLPDLQR